MHDAGKLDMPLEVLGNSSGHVLSPEDLEIVHQHPFDTLHRLQEIPYKGALKPVPEDASMHHEWANGQGYPRHLTIDQIPQAARAIPPADVFDAVTAGRAYMHQRMPLGEVKTMMDSGKGTHFDSSALDSFWNIPADKAISVLESGPHRQPLSSSTLSMFKGHPLGRLLDVTNGATATTQEKNLAQMLTDIYARPAI
jgi:HD-GYP domain-containing protein (c-di-GMP phosphodiesterase class II)